MTLWGIVHDGKVLQVWPEGHSLAGWTAIYGGRANAKLHAKQLPGANVVQVRIVKEAPDAGQD